MLTKKPVQRPDRVPTEYPSIQDEQVAHRHFAPDVSAANAESVASQEPLIAQPKVDSPAVPLKSILATMVLGILVGATLTAAGFLAIGSSEQPAMVLHPPPTAAPTATTFPTAPPAPITVFVVGAVQQTGLIELPPGSRVGDAIQLAGGLLADADAILVNQAAKLSDGAQVYIPFVKPIGETNAEPAEEPPPGISGVLLAGPGGGSSTANTGGRININTASREELDTLPRVGLATADNIIAERPYSSIDDLIRAANVGPSTIDGLRDLVTVE